MSHAMIFQVADLPTITTVLVMVIRLSAGSSTASMLAEIIPEPTTRRLCPVKDNTPPLAYSCHHRRPSTSIDSIVRMVTHRTPRELLNLPLPQFNHGNIIRLLSSAEKSDYKEH